MLDLFLGSAVGSWVLDELWSPAIGPVFSLDAEILRRARARGGVVSDEDPNRAGAPSSPLGLAVHYPVVFDAELLARYDAVYNVHPGYLPWGRGYFPVTWAIWEGTPAGATLHRMVEKIDAGPIVEQIEVRVEGWDTGGSLHARVTDAEKHLLQRYWARLVAGEVLPTSPTTSAVGSFHRRAEFEALRTRLTHSDLGAADLVRLIRALSFPGYPGLVVTAGDRRLVLEARVAPADQDGVDPKAAAGS